MTPCLNRVHFIRDAIESVLAQDYTNFEHIIVDGGSTDGTLELLGVFPHLTVVSEPDKNLYDAINKGIRLASGEIIGLLNTDDLYAQNIFGEIVRLFREHPEIDSVCGKACVFEGTSDVRNGEVLDVYDEDEYMSISPKSVLLFPPVINAKFFRRSVYEKMGLYNVSYYICADREFLLRLAMRGVKTLGLDKILYYYRQHGGSLTIGSSKIVNLSKRLEENLAIFEIYLRSHTSTGKKRYLYKRRHTLISLKIISISFTQKRYRKSVNCAIRGAKYDCLWPVFLAKTLFRHFFSELPKQAIDGK